jgi:hypothetical protein
MRNHKGGLAFDVIGSCIAGAVLVPACGHGSSAGAKADGGGGRDGSLQDVVVPFDQMLNNQCQNGQPCGDAGVCAGGVCCPAALACASACCAGGQVCAFQACVTPGIACIDSTQCGAAEYCDYSLGTTADAGAPDAGGPDAGGCVSATGPALNGRCMPSPPLCGDAGVPEGGPITCIEACEYHPPASMFMPVLEYAWGGQITPPYATDVMMAPIVLPLEDTNCDGQVNSEDIPDIVFSTFTGGVYTANGTLHAIAVRNGALVDRWSVPGAVYPGTQLAGGDIDGLPGRVPEMNPTAPGNEIVACGADGTVHAYLADGTLYWTSAPMGCSMPSIADLDGDGKPEVIVEGGILDGATGATKATYSAAMVGTFAVSDIDGDGKLDIVTSSQGFHSDGTLFVDTGTPGSWPAIGDFDKDGVPEVVAIYYSTHTVSFWHYDATQAAKFSWVRQGIDMNTMLTQHCPVGSAGYTTGGGPPTVADLNGDGTPDVALAGGIGYVAIDGSKVINAAIPNASTLLWSVTSTDCSSAATGSTVFDFNGTGTAEAIYSDEEHLRVYDGPSGNVLWETCNTTGTLEEYPLVADIDGDGHADIVVVSNAYASGTPEYQCDDGTNIAQSGVRVFGNLNWVRTRTIWNEHAYHVTNVNDDGTIPMTELHNWTQPGLNNFRQNKQPGGEFAAPDAVVAVGPQCQGPYGLVATVTNIGEAPLPAGVQVGFYYGTPPGAKLGDLPTLEPLYSAQSESLFLALPNPPPGLNPGGIPVFAIVDDTTTPHPSWHECRTDNDTSAVVSASCSGVQ